MLDEQGGKVESPEDQFLKLRRVLARLVATEHLSFKPLRKGSHTLA